MVSHSTVNAQQRITVLRACQLHRDRRCECIRHVDGDAAAWLLAILLLASAALLNLNLNLLHTVQSCV